MTRSVHSEFNCIFGSENSSVPKVQRAPRKSKIQLREEAAAHIKRYCEQKNINLFEFFSILDKAR
jgi:predicted LPLAT superfamily acyltransferase